MTMPTRRPRSTPVPAQTAYSIRCTGKSTARTVRRTAGAPSHGLHHCVSHSIQLREVRAPTRAADSDPEEQKEAEDPYPRRRNRAGCQLVVAAVLVVVGDCGRCGSKCAHKHNHGYNSAHIWHIRVLPAQQAPEQAAAEVEEGARHRGPPLIVKAIVVIIVIVAFIDSVTIWATIYGLLVLWVNRNRRTRVPGIRTLTVIRAWLRVRWRQARNTDPGRTSPDRRTASRPGSVSGREYYKNSAYQARCRVIRQKAALRPAEGGLRGWPLRRGVRGNVLGLIHGPWVVQRAAHQSGLGSIKPGRGRKIGTANVDGRAHDGPDEPDPEARGSANFDGRVEARSCSVRLSSFPFWGPSPSLSAPSVLFRFAFFGSRGGGNSTLYPSGGDSPEAEKLDYALFERWAPRHGDFRIITVAETGIVQQRFSCSTGCSVSLSVRMYPHAG
jgi:hypothetical protein